MELLPFQSLTRPLYGRNPLPATVRNVSAREIHAVNGMSLGGHARETAAAHSL